MVLSHLTTHCQNSSNSFLNKKNLSTNMNHFAVGVELERTDLGDHTQTSASNPEALFIRAIMHRPICARSFIAHVRYNANPQDIASVLDLQPADAHALWIPPSSPTCSTSPGLQDCSKSHPSTDSKQEEEHQEHLRFTPQSILDCESIVDPLQKVSSSKSINTKYWGKMLDPTRYADLFVDCNQKENAYTTEELEFAKTLAQKLAPFANEMDLTKPYDISNLVEKSRKEKKLLIQKRPTARRCGFASSQLKDIELLCDNMAVYKTGRGLYRAARSVQELKLNKKYFFEVVIINEEENSDGICIGVASSKTPLKRLVGGDESSIGLHSCGQIVRRNGEFISFGSKGFHGGDRVGVKVYTRKQNNWKEIHVTLSFYINGEKQGSIEEVLKNENEKEDLNLHAAVSLYKKGSKAVLQCCRQDWASNMKLIYENEEEINCICGNNKHE